MLERPSLLLNPWAVRTTETGEQVADGRRRVRRAAGSTPPAMSIPPVASPEAAPHAQPGAADFANLDFLADASAVVLNLMPDKDGVVKLPRKELGPHAMIHVVAVDPLGTTYRTRDAAGAAGAVRRSAAARTASTRRGTSPSRSR